MDGVFSKEVYICEVNACFKWQVYPAGRGFESLQLHKVSTSPYLRHMFRCHMAKYWG
jgi:hypothetical protein